MTMLIYVDDLVLTGSHVIELNFIKNHLNKQFNIKELGDLHYFSGLQVLCTDSGIYLTHKSMPLESWRRPDSLTQNQYHPR